LDSTPTKKTTGIKTTTKIKTQVKTEASLGDSLFNKKLKTGLKIPVETTPRIIIAKKGAIRFPASPMAMQNRTRKKTNTALWEIFCSNISPFSCEY